MLVTFKRQMPREGEEPTRSPSVAGPVRRWAEGHLCATVPPSNVTGSYGYDAASELSTINYQLGATSLGNLTYTYDLAGRRTRVGGSPAQTGLPSALAGASYDANNQLTQFGTSNLSYDANGNLTSDGVRTYTWDARNHLASISGTVSASFAYDPFGRRVSETIGPATTNYWMAHGNFDGQSG